MRNIKMILKWLYLKIEPNKTITLVFSSKSLTYFIWLFLFSLVLNGLTWFNFLKLNLIYVIKNNLYDSIERNIVVWPHAAKARLLETTFELCLRHFAYQIYIIGRQELIHVPQIKLFKFFRISFIPLWNGSLIEFI